MLFIVYNSKLFFVYICNVKEIELDKIKEWYTQNKESSLRGRWLPFSKINDLLQNLKHPFEVSKIGQSEQKESIYKVRIGHGKIPILIWSQMHGNESTGTKALFDLFKLFENPLEFTPLVDQILTTCTITFIPMLNPDGAKAYTRVNANSIDLNRDAVDLKAIESQLLHAILQEVNPAYCFNLHDQRTIFTVGDTKKPATLSFLAPSINVSREITEGRKETMRVIVAINTLMQQLIPGQVGRYTDEFYPTATGDNFQKAGHNTILIEAGHAHNDYEREEVRYYNFIALLEGLLFLPGNKNTSHQAYFDIPNNTKYYLDIIYKDIFIENDSKLVSVGVLFKERLKDGKIHFEPEIEIVGDLKQYNANKIIHKKGLKVLDRKELKQVIKN